MSSNANHNQPSIPTLSLSWLGIAAVALGLALQAREGMINLRAVTWLTISLLAFVAAVGSFLKARMRLTAGGVATAVLTIGLGVQLYQHYVAYPGTLYNAPADSGRKALSVLKDKFGHIEDPGEKSATAFEMDRMQGLLMDTRFQNGILLVAAFGVVLLIRHRWTRHAAFAVILATHFLLGAKLIEERPNPHIDVFVFQQESSAALLAGKNPYDITFTNIYGEGSRVYAKELMKDGRLLFGYPYTPMSLYMAVPGYAIAGDHRYSQLAAITLSGLLLAYSGAGLLPKLAALLLLFTPRIFMIVELGWTEPFVILGLCATLFVACRFPRYTPYVLGLFLATKQYLLFAIPLGILFIPRGREREAIVFLGKALVVALVVSAPLVLWNPNAFIHSAITLQLKQPFRNDALTYLAWYWWGFDQPRYGDNPALGLAPRLGWLAFVAVIPAIVLALRKFPRTPAGFAMGMAATYLAFLIFNKQAFCNYYLLVLAAICASAAMLAIPAPAETLVRATHPPE